MNCDNCTVAYIGGETFKFLTVNEPNEGAEENIKETTISICDDCIIRKIRKVRRTLMATLPLYLLLCLGIPSAITVIFLLSSISAKTIFVILLLLVVCLMAIWAARDSLNLCYKLTKSQNGDKEITRSLLWDESSFFSKPLPINALIRKVGRANLANYWTPEGYNKLKEQQGQEREAVTETIRSLASASEPPKEEKPIGLRAFWITIFSAAILLPALLVTQRDMVKEMWLEREAKAKMYSLAQRMDSETRSMKKPDPYSLETDLNDLEKAFLVLEKDRVLPVLFDCVKEIEGKPQLAYTLALAPGVGDTFIRAQSNSERSRFILYVENIAKDGTTNQKVVGEQILNWIRKEQPSRTAR